MEYLYDDATPYVADRILELSRFNCILKAPELLKWSAVALALAAAFGSLVRKLRGVEQKVTVMKSVPLDSPEAECWSSDSSDGEDGVASSFSSEDHRGQQLVGEVGEEEDFRVAGDIGMLRFRRSHPSPPSSEDDGGVVKLWEGFDLRGGGGTCRRRGTGKADSRFWDDKDYSRVTMSVWDRRMRPEIAAVAQEWKPSQEEKAILRHDCCCKLSLFAADIGIWWWVDPTKAVVARLVEFRGDDDEGPGFPAWRPWYSAQ